jgi:hypothetical protein
MESKEPGDCVFGIDVPKQGKVLFPLSVISLCEKHKSLAGGFSMIKIQKMAFG